MQKRQRGADTLSLRSRYRGALVGLAVGDALGTTLEFSPPGSFDAIDDMVGGGPFGLAPGQWTDDTALALCMAESLIERRGFDAIDQLERYVCWWKEGHLSSTGTCFDIGNTTRRSLARFVETREPFPGPRDPQSAGNGSLMRLAPVVLAFAHNPRKAIRRAAASSATTHGAREAIDACRVMAVLLLGALAGLDKRELLFEHLSRLRGSWDKEPLSPAVSEVAAGSYFHKNPPAIRGTGYVVECLEAALWAFAHSDSFREGALRAVNLGDDADTTGAVYGQLAGAYYGVEAIPPEWVKKLARRSTIVRFADALLELRSEFEQAESDSKVKAAEAAQGKSPIRVESFATASDDEHTEAPSPTDAP